MIPIPTAAARKQVKFPLKPSSRFVFHDGNPNANLEERRWQQIAAVIRTIVEQ